jgi:hypothetical protein
VLVCAGGIAFTVIGILLVPDMLRMD